MSKSMHIKKKNRHNIINKNIIVSMQNKNLLFVIKVAKRLVNFEPTFPSKMHYVT